MTRPQSTEVLAMDPQTFDQFARRLSAAISRRTALGASLVALVPGALPTSTSAAGQKKCALCKRPRGPRGRRRCRPVTDNTACASSGRCLRGQCKLPPPCTGSGQDCINGFECCSGQCVSDPGFCALGAIGSPCHVDFDCGGGPSNNFRYRCVGYVCRDTLA
jgi:hypothetical protein